MSLWLRQSGTANCLAVRLVGVRLAANTRLRLVAYPPLPFPAPPLFVSTFVFTIAFTLLAADETASTAFAVTATAFAAAAAAAAAAAN